MVCADMVCVLSRKTRVSVSLLPKPTYSMSLVSSKLHAIENSTRVKATTANPGHTSKNVKMSL